MDRNIGSPDHAVDHLPDTLKVTLALLHAADDDVAELTLGALPLGSRSTLRALGVIEVAGTSAPDAPVLVSLTDFGREVITTCALEGLPEEVADEVAELEEARARRAAGNKERSSGFVEAQA